MVQSTHHQPTFLSYVIITDPFLRNLELRMKLTDYNQLLNQNSMTGQLLFDEKIRQVLLSWRQKKAIAFYQRTTNFVYLINELTFNEYSLTMTPRLIVDV